LLQTVRPRVLAVTGAGWPDPPQGAAMRESRMVHRLHPAATVIQPQQAQGLPLRARQAALFWQVGWTGQ
jgi:hypothetical protein